VDIGQADVILIPQLRKCPLVSCNPMYRLSIHIILVTVSILVFLEQSIGQNKNADNLIKITKAYLEFRVSDSKGKWNKDRDIVVIDAKTIDKHSLWFEVFFANTSIFSILKNSKVYQLDSFKVVISEDLDMKNVLSRLFKEIPYEKPTPTLIKVEYEPSPWHVTLNNKYEIISIESKFQFRKVVTVLKKYKARFASNFHFIQNLP